MTTKKNALTSSTWLGMLRWQWRRRVVGARPGFGLHTPQSVTPRIRKKTQQREKGRQGKGKRNQSGGHAMSDLTSRHHKGKEMAKRTARPSRRRRKKPS